VERSEAESVFALVADLHGELRERLVTGRWWLIWAIMGVQTFATCVVSHIFLHRWPDRTLPQTAAWAVHVVLMVVVVRLVHRRVGGTRTERERLLWGIWLTFIVIACAVDPLNSLLSLPPFTLLPVAALLAAFAFAVTAIGVHRSFWPAPIVFVAASVAMARWGDMRFMIYGGAWLVTLLALAAALRPRQSPAAEAL
jgi:hypothetical protein